MFFCFFYTEETTQSTSEDTTQGATGITTSTLQMDQQTNLEPGDGTADFTFSSLTDAEMADLGTSLLPVAAPSTQSTPPPTYSVIFDNVDFFIRPHHQSISRANKSIHWIHHMAVEDRVPTNHLSRDKPTLPIMEYDIGNSLPGPETQAHMRREFVVLGSRILTLYLDAFKPLSTVVVHHIPHQYSTVMSEASTHVSMKSNTLHFELSLFIQLTF